MPDDRRRLNPTYPTGGGPYDDFNSIAGHRSIEHRRAVSRREALSEKILNCSGTWKRRGRISAAGRVIHEPFGAADKSADCGHETNGLFGCGPRGNNFLTVKKRGIDDVAKNQRETVDPSEVVEGDYVYDPAFDRWVTVVHIQRSVVTVEEHSEKQWRIDKTIFYYYYSGAAPDWTSSAGFGEDCKATIRKRASR